MDAPESDDVLRRLWAEYAEMPDLRLTVQQAQRLCGLDTQTCAAALETLTDAGFLRKTSHQQYTRATDGPASPPSLRMAKADLSQQNERAGQRDESTGDSPPPLRASGDRTPGSGG